MISQRSIRVLHFLVVAVLSMTTLTVWSGTFVDDFNNNKPDGWKKVGGTWKIKDGGYHGVEPNSVEGAVLIGDPKWGPDYSIEAKVRNTKGAWLAIHVRWMDINNHYDWWIDLTNKQGDLYIKKGGYTQKTADNIPLDIKKEFSIKLEVKGFTLSGYFNGKQINTWEDKEKSFKTGIIGLSVWQGEAIFDDIIIEGKNVPGNLAVNSSNKLADTWGRIRRDMAMP